MNGAPIDNPVGFLRTCKVIQLQTTPEHGREIRASGDRIVINLREVPVKREEKRSWQFTNQFCSKIPWGTGQPPDCVLHDILWA
jgi:hypothetical protein